MGFTSFNRYVFKFISCTHYVDTSCIKSNLTLHSNAVLSIIHALFRLSFCTLSARHRLECSNTNSIYGFVLTLKYATVMRRCLPKNRSCSAAVQGLLISCLERQANSLRDRVISPSPDEQAQGQRWRRSCRHRRQSLACAIQMAFFRENLLPTWICFTGQRQTSKRQNSRRLDVIRAFPFAKERRSEECIAAVGPSLLCLCSGIVHMYIDGIEIRELHSKELPVHSTLRR